MSDATALTISDAQVDALNQAEDVRTARAAFLKAKLMALASPDAHSEAVEATRERYEQVFYARLQYVTDNPPAPPPVKVERYTGFARRP